MYVAAELRVADLLASGAKTSEELGRATGVHTPSLHRLMRTLVTFEILREHADGTFELMPMGALLRCDADHSLRSWAILCGKRLSREWLGLLDSVRTGESARKPGSTRSLYEDLEGDQQEAAVFNQAMLELTHLAADGVAQAYDFSGTKRIVDVGGGYGQLLEAILKANPEARGIVFDLPHATEKGRLYFQEIGLADRCEFVSGSFFESVPSGANAYVLKSVIHNWNDERAGVILQRCAQAMAGGGKLILVERIVTHAAGTLSGSPGDRADGSQYAGRARSARTNGGRVPRPAELRRLAFDTNYSRRAEFQHHRGHPFVMLPCFDLRNRRRALGRRPTQFAKILDFCTSAEVQIGSSTDLPRIQTFARISALL